MYKLTKSGSVIRLSDSAIIPCDPINLDWLIYSAWLDEGNSAQDPDITPDPTPDAVSRRQGRRALLATGHLQAVETYLAAIPDDTERMQAQIEYEADTWERSNPWVGHMLELLGLTAEQGDDLFRLGATF